LCEYLNPPLLKLATTEANGGLEHVHVCPSDDF
jgi:hypothetical protein